MSPWDDIFGKVAASPIDPYADMLKAKQQMMHQMQVYQQLAMMGNLFAPSQAAKPKPPIAHGGIKLGELIGHRIWVVNTHGYIKSAYKDTIWAPGEAMTGDIGKDGHAHGVHAWKTKSLMLQYGGEYATQHVCAVGSVRLWGEVVEHERGYRAQYGAVAGFEDVIGQGVNVENKPRVLEHLRKLYQPSPPPPASS